jgi:hypothetical protein
VRHAQAIPAWIEVTAVFFELIEPEQARRGNL